MSDHKPVLDISATDRLLFQGWAAPYLGQDDCDDLIRRIRVHLQRAHPGRKIDVQHIADKDDWLVPRIRVLIIVDDQWDNGLIFTRAPEADANDNADGAEAAA